ncbi:MAG TPA: RluA family pseudouridine synthase [Candidatus Dwaynia gallinarum]|nr:RluA family pseudouridine synthase [Candidatus Dwaynia gallinarum]
MKGIFESLNFLKYKILHDIKDVKIRDYLKYEKGLSSRFIKQASIERRVLVNGSSVKLNYYLKKGDEINIKINRKDETQNIEPIFMELDIIYEDEFILVINKPPFIVVHPSKSHEISLANGIMYHFKVNNSDSIVRLVNRLDMNTSGMLVVAKNQYSHMFLSKLIQENIFKKEYLAIVHGNLKEVEGVIEKNIFRPSDDSIKRVVHNTEGQYAKTIYKVIERYENSDLVNVLIETGRTHQIRVHMNYLGHPIVGDDLYGFENSEVKRQLLHAHKIKFHHPYTKEVLTFKCPMPDDMLNYIEKQNNLKI